MGVSLAPPRAQIGAPALRPFRLTFQNSSICHMRFMLPSYACARWNKDKEEHTNVFAFLCHRFAKFMRSACSGSYTTSHAKGRRYLTALVPTVFDRSAHKSPHSVPLRCLSKHPERPEFTLHVWAAHSLVPRESKQGAESSVWLDRFR
jgi:hypothetical protein